MENIIERTFTVMAVVAIAVPVIAFAWVLFDNLPWWAALMCLGIGMPLLGLVIGPLAAAVAGVAGLGAGLLALIGGSVARRVRRAG